MPHGAAAVAAVDSQGRAVTMTREKRLTECHLKTPLADEVLIRVAGQWLTLSMLLLLVLVIMEQQQA